MKEKINKHYSHKKEMLMLESNTQNHDFVKSELCKYYQHGKTSVYKHSRNVAYFSYLVALNLNHSFKLNIDIDTLIKAAFVHDFFRYDWHEKNTNHKWHGYTHPKIAASNAAIYCGASEKEQSIIMTHMWPLTITKIPRSLEAWIVCGCDKYSAVLETINRR